MPDNRKPLIYGAFPVCCNYTVRAHLRHHGAPERRGREDRQQYARSLLSGLYAGHLRPRYHRRPAESGPNHGQYPLRRCLMLSAIRSRWGQRLGQKRATGENDSFCKTKIPEILRFRGFLARREGFEPPAFWSVGCPKEKTEPFWLRFALFTVVCWTDFPLFPVRNCLFQFYSGSKVGQSWNRGRLVTNTQPAIRAFSIHGTPNNMLHSLLTKGRKTGRGSHSLCRFSILPFAHHTSGRFVKSMAQRRQIF